MIDLCKTEGKKVRLIDDDGDVFEGKVGDYIYPDDNEPEVEGIILDNVVRGDGYKYPLPVQFNAPEIVDLQII